MTTPISNKILNLDETLEANPVEKVVAFHNMLCTACQMQNAGECKKEHAKCPVDAVGRAYKRAS